MTQLSKRHLIFVFLLSIFFLSYSNLNQDTFLGYPADKIEHEEMGTCARIEISQDADNADQKAILEVSES